MSTGLRFTGLLIAGALCLPVAGRADTPTTPRRVHKVKKQQPPPPPLPSGPQGPIPQIPLDAIAPVAPQVSYQDGQLTIVAPNSTLGDILRGVRKHTSADIEIPPTANERVVTRLGPGPAREVMAELLNGSRFNYVLLGSPENANQLVRVVLVAKTSDTPTPAAGDNAAAENYYKGVVSSAGKELASVAKQALASLYANTGRTKEAVALYQELINKPTDSVSKVSAELQLAELYQSTNQPLDAKRLYEQVKKDNPGPEAVQIATQKLTELK